MNYKYVKKPIVIEAFQMTDEHLLSHLDWPEWLNKAWAGETGVEGSLWPILDECENPLVCGTLKGVRGVCRDGWIIQGICGEIYPCKPDIFAATYEPFEPN